MSAYSSVSIPIPKNWQDFERHCRVLFEYILNDPATSLNGRTGQPQHGVDIWGRRGGPGGYYVGIQCKGKDSNYGGKVTESELKKEVKKAFKFTPSIGEFFLVTTAPNDTKIQGVARKITKEHEIAGQPMDVTVWGWEELETLICKYPEAMRAFHPDLTPFTDEIISGIDDFKKESGYKFDRLFREVIDIKHAVQNASDTATRASEKVDSYLHGEIDIYRDLINSGRAQTALDLLENLKMRCWSDASSRVRFRIVTNIGAAKLRLGDEHGAADDFLAALAYDPTDKVGMANTALAYLIKGNMSEVVKAAQAALSKDPTNADAASYLIQAHMNNDSITDPFILIPKETHNTPAVRMGVITFFRRRENPEWREAARAAFSLFPDIDEIKRSAAEADLDEIMESRWVLLGQCLPIGFETDILHTATKHLSSLWNKQKNFEGPLVETSLPRNLVLAYRTLGDHDAAAKILDDALAKKPDDIDLIRERAAIYVVCDDDKKALQLLQEKAGRDLGAAIMIAEQLLSQDPEAARKVLNDVDSTDIDESNQLIISFLEIESYFQEGKSDVGLEQAKALAEAYPEKIEVLIFLAHCQNRYEGTLSDETLNHAIELLDDASSFYDRFIIAKKLDKRQRYDEVVDVLYGWVDLTRDTPALRLLLSAMINTDRRRQAHDAVKKLPPNIAEMPFYLRIQSAVHMLRGDYAAAEKFTDKYLKLNPEDLSMRLKWINIRIRRGAESEIKAFLKANVKKLEGNPLDRMYIARWLQYFDFEERSLKLGYEVLLNNQKDPQIHLQYMGLLLLPGKTESINLEVNEIGPDVVFTIKNERDETDSYLIESEERLRIDLHTIAPDHPIAKKASGLRVGDKFIIDEDKDPKEEWIVVSIKHKWLDILHKSTNRFERQFPATKGLEQVYFDENASEPLQPILAKVKARHDVIQTAFDQYEQKNPPLEFISHSFGKSVIDVLYGLKSAGRSFRVCMGTFAERNEALKAIDTNKCSGCVVDILTFHIIRRFNIEDAASVICGPIGLTESSVDVLRRRKDEIESHIGKPLMTLGWEDGKYIREEITEEQLRCALNVIDDDLAWIDVHCEILPAEGAREVPREIKKISDVMGWRFLDSILAAEGSNRLLLCEDFAYRMIGEQYFKLNSSWLQPVLMVAREKNLIPMDKYVEATFHMIDGGFQFISVDSKVLLFLAQDENDQDGKKFATVAKALGGPNADIASHIRVAASFFTEFWEKQEIYPSLKCQAKTGYILENLIKGQGDKFRNIIENLRDLVPSYIRGFDGYLLCWLQGHFLLPFDRRH